MRSSARSTGMSLCDPNAKVLISQLPGAISAFRVALTFPGQSWFYCPYLPFLKKPKMTAYGVS